MPIKYGTIVISPDDNQEYEWLGAQWKNVKTKRIADRNLTSKLEVEALKSGNIYSETVFQDLMRFAAEQGYFKQRTQQATDFMRKAAQNIRGSKTSMRTGLFLEDLRIASKLLPGTMICFYYDAKLKNEKDGKGKDVLPYWDSFPVDIILSSDDKYFICLNLHYLPPLYRAKMLDLFYQFLPRLNEGTRNERLDISWEKLKDRITTFKYFKPCIKKYLKSHVQSHILQIPSPYWSVVSFLPVANWQKASENKVWQDSIKKFSL